MSKLQSFTLSFTRGCEHNVSVIYLSTSVSLISSDSGMNDSSPLHQTLSTGIRGVGYTRLQSYMYLGINNRVLRLVQSQTHLNI